jgi:nicotinate-nucleotide adenylyltransferase
MASAACEQAQLDEVWFMPSKNPPHKRKCDIVPEAHRSQMIHLAIQGDSRFVLSDFELLRDGTTYTADTLQKLVVQYPQHQFFFIMGGDSFLHLRQWYHPEIVMKHAVLLVFSRDDIAGSLMEQQKNELQKAYGATVLLLQMTASPVSSSRIRQKIKQGESVGTMVPPSVEKYIVTNHLYR